MNHVFTGGWLVLQIKMLIQVKNLRECFIFNSQCKTFFFHTSSCPSYGKHDAAATKELLWTNLSPSIMRQNSLVILYKCEVLSFSGSLHLTNFPLAFFQLKHCIWLNYINHNNCDMALIFFVIHFQQP